MSNANAIASFAMPLANHLIRLRIDARDGMTDHSRPYCAAAEGNFATLPGNTSSYEYDPFAGHGVYPRYSPVTLVKNPDGASTRCEEAGLGTYRGFAYDPVGHGSTRTSALPALKVIQTEPRGPRLQHLTG